MPIIIVILGLLAVLFAMPMHAQTQPWSLEQCCDYAVEHNITIKQQENQCRQQEIQLSTARWTDSSEYVHEYQYLVYLVLVGYECAVVYWFPDT